MRKSRFNPGEWLKVFGGRHPLFASSLVAVACVAAADRHGWWGLLCGLACGAAGGLSAGWRRGLAWLLCGWVSAGVFAWRDGTQVAAERELSSDRCGRVRARVLKDARGSLRYWAAPARLLDGGRVGTDVWWEGMGEMPVAGAVVTARGDFGPLQEPRNPGEFNRAAWLRRQGIAAVFRAGRMEAQVETGDLARWGAAIRHDFREHVTAGLADDSLEAGVIRAVVIGESPADADALIAAFRNSGTLHAFSVSGLHVAMVGSLGWLLLSRAGVPRRRAVLLLLPLIFGYSWITGNSAPAVRSAWMAAVFLAAFVFRRHPDLLNALGAVLLVAMLWDGRLLFQPGVQLSYGVVAAIAVGTAWAGRAFAWMAEPELYQPERLRSGWQKFWLGLRRKTAQSLSVSLAAGVGSAPLTAFHFGLVTPVSVLAGLVLVPLVYILLAVALLAVALFPVAPAVARGVNRWNGCVAHASVAAAEAFSAIPGGHFQLGRETRPMLRVFDLDHGAGAACFSDGAGGAVLIDCGDRRGFKQHLAPSLRRFGIEPDSVVLSHPDGGHLGGGSAVWETFRVRQMLAPVERSRSPAFRAWLAKAPAAGVRVYQAAAYESLAFPDGAHLEILHAPDPFDQNTIADKRVAVYRLFWHGWKLLLTSDAGMGTELEMLDAGKDVTADVIIGGHHRSDSALCDRFLDSVHPQLIIASNASFPIEERLAPSAADYWKSRGIQVIDQAVSGAVTLRVDGDGNLRIEGFLGDSLWLLKPR